MHTFLPLSFPEVECGYILLYSDNFLIVSLVLIYGVV